MPADGDPITTTTKPDVKPNSYEQTKSKRIEKRKEKKSFNKQDKN